MIHIVRMTGMVIGRNLKTIDVLLFYLIISRKNIKVKNLPALRNKAKVIS